MGHNDRWLNMCQPEALNGPLQWKFQNCNLHKEAIKQGTLYVLYMTFDRFLLAVESRDLSQADKSIIRVSSFPKISDGYQNFFFCLSTTEAWTFCKMNALNPLIFTSQQKNWEKCLLFNLANFWMMKLTKTSILPNCQLPNSFFWYTCKFCHSKTALGKKTLL